MAFNLREFLNLNNKDKKPAPPPASTSQPQQSGGGWNVGRIVHDVVHNPVTSNVTQGAKGLYDSFANTASLIPQAAGFGADTIRATLRPSIQNDQNLAFDQQKLKQTWDSSIPGSIAPTLQHTSGALQMTGLLGPRPQDLIEKAAKNAENQGNTDLADAIRTKGYNQIASNAGLKISDSPATVFRKSASNIGQTAALALGAGETSAAKGAITADVAPTTKLITAAKSIHGAGMAGAGFNVAATAAQDNVSPTDYLKAAAQGYGGGAAVGTLGAGAGLIKEPSPLGQDGYLSWPGSEKLTPEQYRVEAAKRLSQAASTPYDGAANKGRTGTDTAISNKIAREFQRNPDKFMQKYDVTQPPIVGAPITTVKLPEDHASYFNMKDNTKVAPIKDMVSSKTPEQNAKSSVVAAQRMSKASIGEIPKRDPVLAHVDKNGKHTVLDGNATLTAAQKNGWSSLPVETVKTKGDVIPTKAQMEATKVLVAKAAAEDPVFQSNVSHAAQAIGETAQAGPVKGLGRSLSKAMSDYGGDHTQLKDTVRATIPLTDTSPTGIQAAVDAVGKQFETARVKNGYDKYTSGYKDVKVNVKTPGGHIGEVLLASPEMLHAKLDVAEGGLGGHTLYEISRDKSLPLAQRLEAEAKMNKLYDAAHAAETSRLASSGVLPKSLTNNATTFSGVAGDVRSGNPTIPLSTKPVSKLVSSWDPSALDVTANGTSSPVMKNVRDSVISNPPSTSIIQENRGSVNSTTAPILGADLSKANIPGEIPKESRPTSALVDNSQVPIVGPKLADTAGTAQKATAPKLTEVATGSSKPKIQPNDSIVNTQPLSINVSDKAKQTTKDVRAAYTGDKNSQIVRGNQIAQGIRKITTPEDRRAMTWLNEAGGDIKTLQKWVNDKSPNLDPHRADIQHAITLAQNPSDAYHAMQGYYHASGAAGVKLGSIKDVIDNYNNRIYKQDNPLKPVTGDAKNPALKLTTGHAKQRTYATLYDAVKNGKIPATTDAANLLAIHNEEMARVNANHKLTDTLKANGLGQWVNGNTAPSGMSKLEGLQRTTPFVAKDGTAGMAIKSFAVPDYLASGFKAITEPDYTKRINALRNTGKYQGFVKTVDLSVSAFHHFTFAMQALYQTHGGLDLVNPKFWERLKSQDFNKLEQDFTANTGMTSNIDANMDVMKALTKGDSKIGNIPGIKQVVGLVQKNNSFLFDTLQRQLKVTDYGLKISKWVDKHPMASDAEVTAAKRSIATEINAAYGGLNWEAMGVNKSTVGLLRKVLLAPDWTVSNLELGKKVFQGGPGGRAARAHVASAIIAGSLLTEGLNKAITGHTTDQNGKGHEFEVEVRPGVYVSFFRGGIGDMLKLGSRVQQSGPISGPSQFLQGKLAPFARTAIGVGSGVDYNGQRFSTSTTTPLEATKKIGGFIANSTGPVPFGAANIKALATNGISDPTSYGLVGTGLARPGTKAELQSVNSSGDSQKLRNLDKNQLQQYQNLPKDQQQAFLDKLNETHKINQEKSQAKTAADSGKVTKISDGSLYAKVGNSYRTFKSQQELDHAKAELTFKDSGKPSQTVGDTYFYKTKTGGIASKPKAQYDYQSAKSSTDLALTRTKTAGDLNGWLNTAAQQYQAIDDYKKTLDPNTDQKEINSLTKQQESLKTRASTYGSYGGFTKAKRAKASKATKAAKVARAKGFSSARSTFPKSRNSGALRSLIKKSTIKAKKVKV